MATKQMKKNELKFEDFEPVSELQELPEKFILVVNLPGFRKQDFRVQIDATGKLSVKGQKQFADNKCKRFNKVIQLPPDSDTEKIRGKFEGEVLSITLPKIEKPLPSNQEVKSSTEEAEAKPTDEEKASEKKEEETKPKEEPEQTTHKKDEEVKPKETETDNFKPKETKTDDKVKDEPSTNGEKKEELAKATEGTSITNGEKKEEPAKAEEGTSITNGEKKEELAKAEEGTSITNGEKKEEPAKAEEGTSITNGEKKEEPAKAKEGTSMPGIKEAASRINDAINKWKQSYSSGENKEKTMKKNEEKKIVTWKEKISQEARGWSEYASFDSMRDTVNRNRKEIAIAVAAFSIGFLVSRKLSSRK